MSLLACHNVSFSYDGKCALKDINFEINQGDYLCIVGENGAGKSTLIKGILNLKKPSSGSILMDKDIKPWQIGYLPQQTQMQRDFPASVYEVVLSGRLNSLGHRIFYNKEDKLDVDEKLEKLEITHLKNKCYRELSGGQQQRVLLARALCAAKKMILLDEPLAGLDPIASSSLYRLISQINIQDNITVIMVSHDVRCSVDYATHILQLGNKQLFFGRKLLYMNSDIGKYFLDGGFYNDRTNS